MFNFDNLNIKIYRFDTIDIGNDLDNSTIQYLIEKYFYVTGYYYNEYKNLVKVTYDIYSNLYIDLLTDANLSVNVRKMMVLYVLASLTGCLDIYMLTSNQFLDSLTFVFNIKRKNEIMFTKWNATSKYNDYILYLGLNDGSYINRQEFDDIIVNDNQLNTIRLKRIEISNQNASTMNLTQGRVVLIENENLTESDYDNIREVYDIDNNNHTEVKKFIFKLIFDDNNVWILWLKNVYLMFNLRNQISNFLMSLTGLFNSHVFKYKICSAVMDTVADSQWLNDSCVPIEQKYADFIQFGETSGYSSKYCNGNYVQTSRRNVSLYYSYYVNIVNREIESYIINNYFDSTNLVTNNYNDKINNCLNAIKQCYNFNAQQLEYYDLKGEFIDTNIGDLNNSYYVDILGYDSTNNKPIVLYISNKVQLDDTHFVYYYKVQSGGIEPINNNYLQKPYDKTVSESSDLIASLVISMYEPTNKMDLLQTYNEVLGISCDKPLIRDVENDIKYLVNNLYVTDNFDTTKKYYIQKHKLFQYAIEANSLLPYQVTVELFNELPSTCNDVTALLEKYLVYDSTDIQLNVTYNNIFLQYRKYMTPKYFYFVTNDNLLDWSYSNLLYVNNIFNEIKNKHLVEYLIDNTRYENLRVYKVNDLTNVLVEVNKLDTTSFLDDIILKIPSVTEIDVNCDSTECDFGDYKIREASIFTLMFDEKISEYIKDNYDTNDIYLLFYNYTDILTKSPNNFIITNKVIGVDQLLWYGFKSSLYDLSFNNLFLKAIVSMDGIFFLYDMYMNKLYTLKFNNINVELGVDDTKPPKFNFDVLYNKKMYKIDRTDIDTALDVLSSYDFFSIINNIRFSYKPYDVDTNKVFWLFCNDFVIVGDET